MDNLDREIVVLNACSSIINDMVNRSIFTVCGKNDSLVITNEELGLLPHTEVHQKFFNILLVELLSGPNKEVLGLEKIPENKNDIGYLYYLTSVAGNPQLNPNDYVKLQKSVNDFINWLEEECTVEKVWPSSIDKELNFKISRWQFIKICGDISKHGFIRLSKRIDDIISVLNKNNFPITKEQAYLVLPEFYEWFHNDIFNYHINTIAEFLNEINWSIYDYIKPIRDNIKLETKITNQVVESMYFDLKNFKPYIPRFKTSKYLKMRY